MVFSRRMAVAAGVLLALAACGRGDRRPDPAPTASAADLPAPEISAAPENTPEPSPSTAMLVPVAPTPAIAPDEEDSAIPIDAPSAQPTLSLALPDITPVARTSSAPAPAPVAEAGFAPHDDCAKLPGWPDFRDRLAKAVADRNAHALADLAARDVKLDYGGGSGRGELRKRLADPKLGLWRELAQILPLGCADANGILSMPWYFWNLPTDIDAYNAMLVTGDAVPLRARPDPGARVVATLDWPIVTVPAGKADLSAKYTSVRTRAGKLDGYVLTAKLRSVLAYRLIAERQDGKWRLTAFTAGD